MRPQVCVSMIAIAGVSLSTLPTFRDERGSLTELFRNGESAMLLPQQWNLVHSEVNTLRGVHVHLQHDDYLVVLSGELRLGLHDIRPRSPTRGASALIALQGPASLGALVPQGVLHGFYFPEPTTYVYGLSQGWSPRDDLGCRWDDPALGIAWPATDPILSERDRSAGSLAALIEKLRPAWCA
jgi:dTDP-4-dehydrorhamnose 3,5-epimerase